LEPARPRQASAAANHATIQFGGSSVEIKSDWISLASIGLDCNNLPPGFTQKIHVETIHGNCFGLAGMHLISKLLDQWIWATFEPQSPITNPNRCQVLGCTDSFGSNPAVTHGTPTALTPQLSALMTAANLAPEWFNYRLDGVQTGFFQPKLLGNSIIEGENAGVPLTQASCITCHSVSSVKNDGTDGHHPADVEPNRGSDAAALERVDPARLRMVAVRGLSQQPIPIMCCFLGGARSLGARCCSASAPG
jgi:hypothetical protein